MYFIGPFHNSSNRILLLGGGELGKEVIIEAQRLGCYTIVCDRYENAPAMQVSHESHVFDMNNYDLLKDVILKTKPTHIVPEIESINIKCLLEMEKNGYNVVPSAKAVSITMHRQKLREIASMLDLNTTKYIFCEGDYNKFLDCIEKIGIPCVVKPSMSSSGKGQTIVKKKEDIKNAWEHANSNSRGNCNSIIIEEFLNFDYELTLLTVSQNKKISFCNPIKHIQKDGDFIYSSQPADISNHVLSICKMMSIILVENLGGDGIFGVEFFVKNDKVYFNECSPRPHDTGYITTKTQNMSEFELHVRAFLGLSIPEIIQYASGISKAINFYNGSNNIVENPNFRIENDKNNTISIYNFGKPIVNPLSKRRIGLLISTSKIMEEAEKNLDTITLH